MRMVPDNLASHSVQGRKRTSGRSRTNYVLSDSPAFVIHAQVDEVLLAFSPILKRPCEIHGLRVACRRLSASLQVWRNSCEVGRERGLAKDLQWLIHCLSDLRELDVLKQDITKSGKEDPSKVRKTLIAIVRRRSEAVRKASARLSGPRATRLRVRLYRHRRRLLDLTHLGRDEIAALGKPVLDMRFEKLCTQLNETEAHDSRALHKLRLQVKKMRYTLEYLAPVLLQQNALSMVLMLQHGQDKLGAIQDACVEQRRLSELGAVTPRIRSRALATHESVELSTVLRDLAKLRPFWR